MMGRSGKGAIMVLMAAGMAAHTWTASAAQAWRSYVNPRFGSAADVPANWRSDASPANGDGQRFVSPDGRASITVSGVFRGEDSIEAGFAERAKVEEGETVTYQHRSPNAVVVSGLRGDTIFYRKSVLGCADRIWNDLVVEYPARRRAALDPVVEHAAASLHQGRGVESATCRK